MSTIKERLENLGALKTGGKGSVYKGRRVGEIFTAVKLIPTPVHSESQWDKNFINFQNKLSKLKKLNDPPNPNVVRVLNSGITDTGNLPFIEMEFIEGPDLEELLKPPQYPIFSIRETLKVAGHLSNALAQWHRMEIKHGDVKTNNVKYNINTGNYVLLDIGSEVMSDAPGRTKMFEPGCMEFISPEQYEGRVFFQTDVYSFGVILFKLLAGGFPLIVERKEATAKNSVTTSHMKIPQPSDFLSLRKQHIPHLWSEEEKQREIRVPEWLIRMIYKCLEKNPKDRFANGMELQEHIALNNSMTSGKEDTSPDYAQVLQEKNELLLVKDQLKKSLEDEQLFHQMLYRQWKELKEIDGQKDKELQQLKQKIKFDKQHYGPEGKGVSKYAFYGLLLITTILSALTAYHLFFKDSSQILSTTSTTLKDSTTINNKQPQIQQPPYVVHTDVNQQKKDTVNNQQKVPPPAAGQPEINIEQSKNNKQPLNSALANKTVTVAEPSAVPPAKDNNSFGLYKVKSKAFFHNHPEENTRRRAFIIHWNNATLTALDDKNGFIYIVFTNHLGQTSKGWLDKKDLNRIDPKEPG